MADKTEVEKFKAIEVQVALNDLDYHEKKVKEYKLRLTMLTGEDYL